MMKASGLVALGLTVGLMTAALPARAGDWGACWRYVENKPHACEMVDDWATRCDHAHEQLIFGAISRGFPKNFYFYSGRRCR